jgi:hypothetical protein
VVHLVWLAPAVNIVPLLEVVVVELHQLRTVVMGELLVLNLPLLQQLERSADQHHLQEVMELQQALTQVEAVEVAAVEPTQPVWVVMGEMVDQASFSSSVSLNDRLSMISLVYYNRILIILFGRFAHRNDMRA